MKKCNSAFQIEFQMIFPAPVMCASATAFVGSECFPCTWMVSCTPAEEYLEPHEMRLCRSHTSPVTISSPPSPRKFLSLWSAGCSQSS